MDGRRRMQWAVVLAVALVDGWLHGAWAIPAFSATLDLPCAQCHTMAPALNDFGVAYRVRGYRMVGLTDRLPEAARERLSAEGTGVIHAAEWPLSARLGFGYQYRSLDNQDTDLGESKIQIRTSGIDRLDLMSGGQLADNVSVYVNYQPTVTNATLNADYGSDGRLQGQEGGLAAAWVSVHDLAVTARVKGTVRLGLFELDGLALHRLRHTMSGYPIAGYFPSGSAAADDPETTLDRSHAQLGVEWSGRAPWRDLAYSLALINGTNGRNDSNTAVDYYARVSLPVEDHRVGLFGYWGAASTDLQYTSTGDPIAGTGDGNQTFYRMGVDGDVRVPTTPIRVLALAEYGSDSAGLFGGSDPQTASFGGGWIEVQYDLVAERAMRWILRYDLIRNFSQGDAFTDAKKGDLDGMTASARYGVLRTDRLSLLVHGEYSHVKRKAVSFDGNDRNDNRITLALDLMM